MCVLVLVVIIVCSSGKSRIKFNTFALEWSKCMEMCPKYNRAQVPSFTDQTEMEELISWALETTTDPDTNLIYPDGFSQSFWVPFRYDTMQQFRTFLQELVLDMATMHSVVTGHSSLVQCPQHTTYFKSYYL